MDEADSLANGWMAGARPRDFGGGCGQYHGTFDIPGGIAGATGKEKGICVPYILVAFTMINSVA